MKPICVVLTGAGISAESGIPTFRAEDGLWAGHKVEEVCTPEALQKNRAKVLDFYNQRRKNAAVPAKRIFEWVIKSCLIAGGSRTEAV